MEHPNKQSFIGVLTILDEPSDKAPEGARGHRVLLPYKVGEKALPTIIGMGVNISRAFTENQHDASRKIGVITDAWISSNKEFCVSEHIWLADMFNEVCRIEAASEDWGMSYELKDCGIQDMRSDIWTIKYTTFSGACIIPQLKAAYSKTSFILV